MFRSICPALLLIGLSAGPAPALIPDPVGMRAPLQQPVQPPTQAPNTQDLPQQDPVGADGEDVRSVQELDRQGRTGTQDEYRQTGPQDDHALPGLTPGLTTDYDSALIDANDADDGEATRDQGNLLLGGLVLAVALLLAFVGLRKHARQVEGRPD